MAGEKYHVNQKTGRPNRCYAQEGNCPLKNEDGTKAPHFETKEAARRYIEKENNEKYGETKIISKKKKKNIEKMIKIKENFLQSFEIRPFNIDLENNKYWKDLNYDLDNERGNEIGDKKRLKKEKEEVLNFVKDYINGNIPEETPAFLKNSAVNFTSNKAGFLLRNNLRVFANSTKKFAREVKDTLPDDAVVLDPMAGKGYLVKSFREAGIPTIASDDNSWDISYDNDNIENCDALQALENHKDEATHIVIAWPPYREDIGYKIMKKADDLGMGIIYIGEEIGGCTADERFHEHFEIDNEFSTYENFKDAFDYAVIGHYNQEANIQATIDYYNSLYY